MTPQWLRVVSALICKHDMTTGEIYTYLERAGHRVRNITGRISDARKEGVTFIMRKDSKGLHRYSVDFIPEKVAGMITFGFAPRETKSDLMHLGID